MLVRAIQPCPQNHNTDQGPTTVRHLSLADKVIVLGTDGRIAEQGTFDNLKTQDGFVSRLLVNPELLQSKSNDDPSANNGLDPKAKLAAEIPKALRGPTNTDVEDLTRQIGDVSVYKYYLKSISWKLGLINVTGCLIWALADSFPCE